MIVNFTHVHIYSIAGIVVSLTVVVIVVAILVFLLVACCCPCCRYSLRIDLKKSGCNKLVCVDKAKQEPVDPDLEKKKPLGE